MTLLSGSPGDARDRSAATKYLITFPHRRSSKSAMTPPTKQHQETGYEAQRPRSELSGVGPAPGASPESEQDLMVLDVGCANQAPAVVRAALSELRELDAVRDDVILVASELVTNAVIHSSGTAADTIQVRAVLTGGNVVISVTDPGLSDDTPQIRAPDVLRASGHGLRIVSQLGRWGFDCGGPESGRNSRPTPEVELIVNKDLARDRVGRGRCPRKGGASRGQRGLAVNASGSRSAGVGAARSRGWG
jgi:hypothetical protein